MALAVLLAGAAWGCAPVVTVAPAVPVAEPSGPVLTEAQVQTLALARGALEAREYDRALELFRAILAENPGVGSAYVGIGQVSLDRGEYAAAEAAFARGARLEPRSFDAQYGHGVALQMLERFVDAVRAFHRALTIRPQSAKANLSLATTYLQMDRPDSALMFAERAVELEPARGAAHANLGAIYEQLQRDVEAVSQYEAAIELLPEPPPPLLLNLLNVLARQHRYTEARNTAAHLVRIAPSADAYERLGWCAFRMGDYSGSIEAYRAALRLDPDHWPSLNGVGCNALNTWLLGGKRDPEAAREARDAFRRSLRSNPDQPRVIELMLRYEL